VTAASPAQPGPVDSAAEDLAAAGIHLDSVQGKRERARAAFHANTRTYPLLRFWGFHLLLAGVALHNVFVLKSVDWTAILQFALVVEVYCLTAWLLLRRYYGRFSIGDLTLAEVFFTTDLIFWTLAIYVSGAERSWLFFILLLRVADHVYAGVRTAMTYAHAAVLCYGGLLFYVAVIEARPIDVAADLAKLLFLYIAGLYLASTAAPVARMRNQNTRAIRLARDLISKLDERTRQLVQEKRRAEDAKHEAVKANDFKSVLLSRVSHEFRTPLHHILGFSQILGMDELTDAQRASLEEIESGGRRLLQLVDGMLDISAAETGALDLRAEDVAIAALIENAIEHVRRKATQREIPIRAIGAHDLQCHVHADRARLEQVLTNLLRNAVDYNRPGGEVHVMVEMQGNQRVRISVRDTGPGIPAERLESLFLPFERLDSAAHEPEGKGLGLVLSKTLVESMGGSIAVRSERGLGSTFVVELPVGSPLGNAPPS
jgi:signal transduction histidine kinase